MITKDMREYEGKDSQNVLAAGGISYKTIRRVGPDPKHHEQQSPNK